MKRRSYAPSRSYRPSRRRPRAQQGLGSTPRQHNEAALSEVDRALSTLDRLDQKDACYNAITLIGQALAHAEELDYHGKAQDRKTFFMVKDASRLVRSRCEAMPKVAKIRTNRGF